MNFDPTQAWALDSNGMPYNLSAQDIANGVQAYVFDPTQPAKNINGALINLTAPEIAAIQAAQTAAAAAAPKQAALAQILALENSVSERMKREALVASIKSFPAGSPYAGQTSAQVIVSIEAQIETIRTNNNL